MHSDDDEPEALIQPPSPLPVIALEATLQVAEQLVRAHLCCRTLQVPNPQYLIACSKCHSLLPKKLQFTTSKLQLLPQNLDPIIVTDCLECSKSTPHMPIILSKCKFCSLALPFQYYSPFGLNMDANVVTSVLEFM
jgi:hypothetical protein